MHLPSREAGQYLLLLLAQWASKDVGGVFAEDESLLAVLRGEQPTRAVLAKFERIQIDGREVLRNARLWEEWVAASTEYRKMTGEIPPQNVSQTVKDAVFMRDGGKCVDCGSTQRIEYDHDIPRSHGGPATVENIRLRCASCNQRKGNKARPRTAKVPPPITGPVQKSVREPEPQPEPETDTATSSTPSPDIRCPVCRVGAVVRERYPRGLIAGWVCWKQRKGCGALYAVNDPMVLDQLTEEQRRELKRSVLRESGLRTGAGEPPPPPRASSDPAVPAVWETIREKLRATMKPDQWKIWIETVVPLRFEEDGACIVLLSPHPGHAQWLMENHGQTVSAAVKEVGLAAFKIEFPDSAFPKVRGLPL